MSLDALHHCPAPAKLNLFLHVLGREPAGSYHRLQTVFQLIDWQDTLHFTRRNDAAINRLSELDGVAPDDDLTVRAARLFQSAAGVTMGVDIVLDKQLPMGGGLGGGSSNAATTLLALNRLWGCHWPLARLRELGGRLGADVPFFLLGRNAFAHGRGDKLQVLDLPLRHYVVIHPPVQVSTATVFAAPELTRHTEPIKIAAFIAQQTPGSKLPSGTVIQLFGQNDLEPVVLMQQAALRQQVDRWRQCLARSGHPLRMTGSGACFFVPCADAATAGQIKQWLDTDNAQPAGQSGWQGPEQRNMQDNRQKLLPQVKIAKGLSHHPFHV